eukprot:PhF_6_TR38088/c0_g1_i1/m.56807
MFKDRQEGAYSEMCGILSRIRKYLVKYEAHREHLEKKKDVKLQGEFDFVESNVDEILAVLNKERAQKFVELSDAYMHHVRDEIELLYPALFKASQGEAIHAASVLEEMLQPTTLRRGCDMSCETLLNAWRTDFSYLSYDNVKLSNAMRVWPAELTDVFMVEGNTTAARTGTAEQRAEKAVAAYWTSWKKFFDKLTVNDLYVYEHVRLETRATACSAEVLGRYTQYLESVSQAIELQQEEIVDCDAHLVEVAKALNGLPPLLEESKQLKKSLLEKISVQYDKMKAVLEAEPL